MSRCRRLCKVLRDSFPPGGEGADAELPLKLSRWVGFFLFLQGWGSPCLFMCVCFKMLCSWVLGASGSALGPLTASLAEGMLFLPALQRSELSRSGVLTGL